MFDVKKFQKSLFRIIFKLFKNLNLNHLLGSHLNGERNNSLRWTKNCEIHRKDIFFTSIIIILSQKPKILMAQTINQVLIL